MTNRSASCARPTVGHCGQARRRFVGPLGQKPTDFNVVADLRDGRLERAMGIEPTTFSLGS